MSIGVVDRLKKDTIIESFGICDIYCNSLQKIAETRFKFKFQYDQLICKNLDFINQFFGNPCSKFLAWTAGLVLGQGDLFDTQTKTGLKKVGIIHLLVISGFQVGLLFVFVNYIFLKIGFIRKIREIYVGLPCYF